MKLALTVELITAALGRERALVVVPEIEERTPKQRVSIDISGLLTEEVDKIAKVAAKISKPAARRIAAWRDLREDPEGKPIWTALEMETALIHFIVRLPHKMIFERGEDGQMLPYYVTEIKFHEAEKHVDRDTKRVWWDPPYVTLHASGYMNEHTESIKRSWEAGEKAGSGGMFVGLSVEEMLERADVFPEREKTYERYKAELARFHELYTATGRQMLGIGRCHDGDAVGTDDEDQNYRRHRRRRQAWEIRNRRTLTREGQPSRVVIDMDGDKPTKEDEEDDNSVAEGTTSAEFWRKYEALAGVEPALSEAEIARAKHESKPPINDALDLESDEEDDDGKPEEERTVVLPTHPYVQVFDFASDSYARCHVNCLTEYSFAHNIQEKLVLPQSTKDLVTTLIGTAREVRDDIVAGKSGGVIVMSTGLPGTGKTLTAEVFAEEMKIPIYLVQCSQLGTTSDELEKLLNLVLRRAVRWGALLLVDEADVYVRTRENDIEQNAIVGVFLRLLERFRGILFMTSNRATAIDDAILSRCIAHIRYDLPTEANLAQIWSVLSDNYDVFLSPGEMKQLAKEFPKISGRNVKTLLKLAMAVTKTGEGGTRKQKPGEAIELIRKVAQFVDFPREHYEAVKKKET